MTRKSRTSDAQLIKRAMRINTAADVVPIIDKKSNELVHVHIPHPSKGEPWVGRRLSVI